MIRRFACALLAGLAMPALAAETTLNLPTDARIDVQVIDRITLDQNTPRRSDVLLRPVTRASTSATHQLPEYCLITADAQLDGERLSINTRAVTCIEPEGDTRTIYSGKLSAAGFDSDGDYGLNVCEASREADCIRAVLMPSHIFQLNVGSDTVIPALDNPSEKINKQRRQANGEGIANPIPAQRPNPDANTP